ncbi:glucosyltransferase domain-containing protein [Ureibacillus thermophilus]|uniref:Glucosyl transferase GtrII n=1 Tax=Ureibacillus thermophilus TaxID=367743 RepID=A0A4P6UR77_9BACL|nr:glucosyltransferase domain-containing protein [Ureibacillus thermophilus]QBK25504.1 hypothetical protein DKZ56_06345 [Ureibacillus thermophilus]
MPEQVLKSLKEKIQPEWVLAFFSAVMIGFLAHAYVFLHRLPNHDGIINIYNTQAKVKSGRFFLGPASGMSSFFDLPWVIGVLSILFLGLAAVCIIILFDVRKKLAIVLISGIIVVFPSVSATFAYMFTADGYMLGIFFAILAVVLTKKYKFGFLIGAILLCLSVGIYQANLSVALVFITLWIIHEILFSTFSTKVIGLHILRSGLAVGIGMVLYLAIFNFFTKFLNVQITSYQGLDKVGAVTIHDIPKRLVQIKEELLSFFFDSFYNHHDISLLPILNVFIFITLIAAVFTVIVKKHLYKNLLHMILFIVLVMSLPFSYYIVYFISPVAFYHTLMVFSLSSVYIFLVLLYDAVEEKRPLWVEKVSSWATVLLMSVAIFNFAIIANISYFNMELRHEKTMNLTNRILDRIEQLDEYEDIKKMTVFGKVPMHSELTSEIIPNRIPHMIGTTGEVFISEPYHYTALFDSFFGYSLDIATEEERKAIQQSREFKEMGVWPAKDSIKVFDDIVVVKFEDIE